MNEPPEPYMSLDEYYAFEEHATIKHEYLHGQIYAMSGGSATHSQIAMNIGRSIGNRLSGKPCIAYTSDLRIKIEDTGMQAYPDVSVACPPIQYADNRDDVITNPTVIVEVLSPGTERFDRGLKFQHYRTIPSLRAYLLIAQDAVRVEQYTRQANNTWLLTEYTALDQSFPLDAIGVTVTLAEIYEKVEFEAESRTE